MDNNRCALMRKITAASFMMDDLRLFLNTHPDDCKAQEMFEEYRLMRQRALDEHNECYGPLQSYDVLPTSGSWAWNRGPMPWEKEA